jgi:hypothetical protein
MALTCVSVNMGPAHVNLRGVRAGDRNLMNITVLSGGDPVDLTGTAPAAQARAHATDPDPAITALAAVADAENGVITVQWRGEDVRALLNGSGSWAGVWDLQIVKPGLDPWTIAAGSFAAEQDVTR